MDRAFTTRRTRLQAAYDTPTDLRQGPRRWRRVSWASSAAILVRQCRFRPSPVRST